MFGLAHSTTTIQGLRLHLMVRLFFKQALGQGFPLQQIQRSDANNLAWVETLLLPKLAHGWHNGVDWIHNQRHNCIWAILGTCLHDVLGLSMN
eukprot:2755464-Amphidinium_carterae.1